MTELIALITNSSHRSHDQVITKSPSICRLIQLAISISKDLYPEKSMPKESFMLLALTVTEYNAVWPEKQLDLELARATLGCFILSSTHVTSACW
jgi:hypothetical protein